MNQTQSLEKVKVTHTLTRRTRDEVRQLVAQGVAKDASDFIERALEQALHAEKLKHLELELEAFDDPEYRAQIAKFGDTGLEDLQPFLKDNDA